MMANQLKMADVYAILALRARRWSCRRIGEELGIHRDTVRRYVRLTAEAAVGSGDPPGGGEAGGASSNASTGSADQNQPNPPPGSKGQDPPNPPLGADLLARLPDGWLGQNRPNPPPGSSGPASRCEPLREVIEAGLEQGLSGQRIWQDLRTEHEFGGSYDRVKRFVRRLRRDHSLPFRRMECEPAAEAQVDFGTGAPVVTPDGKRRRTHVFRIVLSHSRRAYSEAVFRQTTDDFIRCQPLNVTRNSSGSTLTP